MSDATLRSTGIGFIDEMLGGGLEPGTMTVVHGATGVGKTHLGLSFANQGDAAEGRRGVIVDCTTRGDSQQHGGYAARLFGWDIHEGQVSREDIWRQNGRGPDLFTGLDYSGVPPTRASVDDDGWHDWNCRLARRLDDLNTFLYWHFVRGVKRLLIDGIEPCDRVEDSVQLKLIEHTYQRVLRTDDDWVARSLFRGQWGEHKASVEAHRYSKREIATMVLQTSHEVMLQDLMSRNVLQGDLATNANTIILLGRWPLGTRVVRAAFVLKHRGRTCSEDIVPFTVTENGLEPL